MTEPGSGTAVIRDFAPGDLDWVIERHAALYAAEHGFDLSFRAYVEGPVRRFGASRDPLMERLWVAEAGDRRVGMIAVVRADDGAAQLRWFLVEPGTRGQGVGSGLIRTALLFCREAGYRRALLWTVSEMTAARRLYQAFGFRLAESVRRPLWGGMRTEERWDLDL